MGYKIGDIVVLTKDAAESYGTAFADRKMRITAVAHSRDEHPGYDDGVVGQGLYDLVDAATGEAIPNSLYEYEVESH